MLPGTRYLVLALLAVALADGARRHDQQQQQQQQHGDQLRHHKHRHHHELEASSQQQWTSLVGRRRPLPEDDDPGDYDYSYDEDYEAGDEGSASEDDYPPRSERRYPSRSSYAPPAPSPSSAPKRHNSNSHHRQRYAPSSASSSRSNHHLPRGRHVTSSSRFHDRIAHHHKASSRPTAPPPHRRRYKGDDADDDDDDDLDDQRYRHHHSRRYQDEEDDGEYRRPHGKHRGSKRLYSVVGTGRGRRSRYEPRKDWRYDLDDEEDEEVEPEAEEEEDDDSGGYEADYEDDDEDADDDAEEDDEDEEDRLFRKHVSKKAELEETRRRSNKFDEWLRRTRLNSSRSHRPSSHRSNEADWSDREFWKRFEGGRDENEIVVNSVAPVKSTWEDILRLLGEDKPAATSTTPRPTTQIKRNTETLRRDLHRLRGAATTSSPRKRDFVDVQADASTNYAEDSVEEKEATTALSTTTTGTTPATTTTTIRTTTNLQARVASRRQTSTANHNSSRDKNYGLDQSKNDYPAMSPHSNYKWQSLGSRESVDKTRNSMTTQSKLNSKYEKIAWEKNYHQVSTEGSCRVPRVKLVPVRDVLTDTTTATYKPRCVMLHRCSDDTGCCPSETQSCEAKTTENVEIPLWVTHIGGKTEIKKFSFVNHTACECHEITLTTKPPQNIIRAERNNCTCTDKFTSKIRMDGQCECNCEESNKACLMIQRGKIPLSLKDRLCVQNKTCTPPNCSFGDYESGTCPTKREIFEPITQTYYN